MKERNTGIDLLRIAAMYMITILHTLGQGGAMVRIVQNPAPYNTAWYLETMAMSAVNIYGMISGYVGVDSRFKPSSFVKLYLRVFFYSSLLTLVMSFMYPGAVTPEYLRKGFMPVLFKAYWYFTAYAGVFFLIPFLNRMLKDLDEKRAGTLFFTLFIVFSVLSTLSKSFGTDSFSLAGGYTFVWLLIMYMMGACLKKSRLFSMKPVTCILVYFATVTFSWAFKCLMEDYTRRVLGEAKYGRAFVAFTSPTIVICAVVLIRLFAQLHFSERAAKIIGMISPLAFSVYLIHTHPMVWDLIMKNRFSDLRYASPVMLFAGALLRGLMILGICLGIDVIRMFIFRFLHIDRLGRYFDRLAERKQIF